jgi:hypothetical protein
MLTKQDLNSIGTIVRTELVPVRKDINKLQVDVKKLRKDLDKTIDFFDKSNVSTREKVNKTRTDLGLNEVAFAY